MVGVGSSLGRAARPPFVRWGVRLCICYGSGASLTLLAIAVVGDRWAWTYLAGLVCFWWLVPAPFLLSAALAVRARAAVAVLVAPTVVSGYLEGPHLLNALSGSSGADADLRVATYNLTNGRPLDGLVTLTTEHQPDILLLQEVTASRDEFLALLPEYPYASMGPGVSGPGHDGYAILSRHPVVEVRPVTSLPEGARPADLVTVDVDGRETTLLSVHLASPCIGCTDADRHHGGNTTEAGRLRMAEADRYAEVLARVTAQGRPAIVGGDLNASPLNRPLRELTCVGLVDAQRAVGTSPGLTRGPGPGVARVDAVLVAGLTPVRVTEGARGSSTHSPVVADLAWPESGSGQR